MPPADTRLNKWLRRLHASYFAPVEHGIESGDIHRVVVMREGGIGDIIVATPAIRILRDRFPDAHLTLITLADGQRHLGAQDVLATTDLVNEIVDLGKLSGLGPGEKRSRQERRRLYDNFIAHLKRMRIDLLVKLTADKEGVATLATHMAMARKVGVKYAVGFQCVTHEHDGINQVDRLIEIVRPLAPRIPHRGLELSVSREDELFADRLIQNLLPHDRRFRIAVHAGGDKATNRWSPERYGEVLRRAVQEFDLDILQIGGPRDTEFAEKIKGIVPEAHSEPVGKTTIPQLAALLRRCNLLLANDGGPMHVAAAVGTPVLAVFSARDMPGKWYPHGASHRVIRKHVPCSPCLLFTCNTHECMEFVSVEEVYGALAEMIRELASG